jgi:hypothetical protein
MTKSIALIPTLLITTVILAGCSASAMEEPTTAPTESSESSIAPSEETENSDSLFKDVMTDNEIVLAALMGPEGEYAAAASYLAVLDEYGSVEPYQSIYQSELRHIDALIRQLEKAGVVVPENPYLGKVTIPDNLVSIAEAEARVEVLNVEMYDLLISKTENTNLIKVLENLRTASLESHLPAFELAAQGDGTLTTEQMSGR